MPSGLAWVNKHVMCCIGFSFKTLTQNQGLLFVNKQ